MTTKKYELTEETLEWKGHILHRVKALRDFNYIKAGNVGGWVESEDNLSQYGDCWISCEAKVYGDAKVFQDAQVFDEAQVYDHAQVYGNAKVSGNAVVCGNVEICGDAVVKETKDYAVFKNTWSSGRYFTWTRSNDMWRVGCFYGTGKQLIKKAYADGELKGKCYEAIVQLQSRISELLK